MNEKTRREQRQKPTIKIDSSVKARLERIKLSLCYKERAKIFYSDVIARLLNALYSDNERRELQDLLPEGELSFINDGRIMRNI